MKVVLIITLVLLGQEKPAQQAGEMASLQMCEAEAHKFMVHKFPKEVNARVVFKSATCAIGSDPGQPI